MKNVELIDSIDKEDIEIMKKIDHINVEVKMKDDGKESKRNKRRIKISVKIHSTITMKWLKNTQKKAYSKRYGLLNTFLPSSDYKRCKSQYGRIGW